MLTLFDDFSVVPVFLAEISPSHLRGSLVMNWYELVLATVYGFSYC